MPVGLSGRESRPYGRRGNSHHSPLEEARRSREGGDDARNLEWH